MKFNFFSEGLGGNSVKLCQQIFPTTINREIFVLKIFHVRIFRVKKFS